MLFVSVIVWFRVDECNLKSLKNSRGYIFQIARETIIYMKKLCSHVCKSHLEINLKNIKLWCTCIVNFNSKSVYQALFFNDFQVAM